MQPEWANDRIQAWTLEDGTLVIRSRIDKPMDGHDHFFIVDTLIPCRVSSDQLREPAE